LLNLDELKQLAGQPSEPVACDKHPI
jgi:hypothetical protein